MKMWKEVQETGGGVASPFADLTRLGLLAAACRRVAADLRAHAERTRLVAAGRGLDATPVVRMLEVAEWADEEARRVEDLLARIRSWPGPPGLGWAVRDAGHPAHAHPEAAHAAAARVVEALGAGAEVGDPEVVALLARWSANPVFAAEVAAGLGAGGVVRVLDLVDARWGWTGEDAERMRRAARHLAATLATASRHHPDGVTPAGLARAAGRSRGGLRVLGTLFVGRHRFPTAFLTAVVPAVVLPLQAERRATGRPERALLGGVPGGRDVPALVLDRVARDGDAARSVLAEVDLDALLAGDHGDAGFAVARLLEAGTAPTPLVGPLTSATTIDASGGDRLAEAAANLARLTRWMATTDVVVPLGVQRSVDRVLGPWIGSLRGRGLATASVRHAALDERGGRRLLALGMRSDGVRERLVDRAWQWAAAESILLAGREPPGAGFDAVGSVLGVVTTAAHDSAAVAAADADRRRAADRQLWSQVQGAALRFAPPVVRGPLGAIGDPLRDRVLPDTDLELEHWRDDRDRRIAGESLAVEQVVIQALHAVRPGSLPAVALRAGRVRPLWSLGPGERARYDRWRARAAGRGPAPVQLAVERFLAEGRGPRPAAPPPAG